MAYIQTKTPEDSQKSYWARTLWASFWNTTVRLTGCKSVKQGKNEMSKRDMTAIGLTHTDIQRVSAKPLSVDIATELNIRANGHSMRR